VSGDDEAPPPVDLDLAALEEAARQKIGEMAYAYYAGGAEDEQQVRRTMALCGAATIGAIDRSLTMRAP
jgi:hypothetical protein